MPVQGGGADGTEDIIKEGYGCLDLKVSAVHEKEGAHSDALFLAKAGDVALTCRRRG